MYSTPYQLQGLLHKQILRNLTVAAILSAGVITVLKVKLVDKRQRRYAEYYRELDCEKLFNEMRKSGVFNCCPPKKEDSSQPSQSEEVKIDEPATKTTTES